MSQSPVASNAEQIEFWNGATGVTWAARAQRMDELLAPISDAVIAQANCTATDRVLDVGCGCGDTSLRMAATGARVSGVDISAPMLERARQRARAEGSATTFIEADASSAALPADHTLLFSRFGVMFFAAPTAAFSHLHGTLAADGRLCFVCWQAPQLNPWIMTPMAAARPLLAPQPTLDPHAPGPFAFAEPDYVRDILGGARFTDIRTTSLVTPLRLGETLDAALDMVCEVGPLSRVVSELDATTRTAVLAAVRAALQPHCGDAGVELDAACWIVQARASATQSFTKALR